MFNVPHTPTAQQGLMGPPPSDPVAFSIRGALQKNSPVQSCPVDQDREVRRVTARDILLGLEV
jgi:hypothetical protein